MSRPIRICLVAPALHIPGGQAIQATRLHRGLQAQQSIAVEFVPINPRLGGWLRHLQRVRYVRTIATTIRYVWSLVRSLPRCDVVHVFAASYWSFLLAPTPAVVLGKLLKKRVVLNYRSGEAEDHLRRWSRTALPVLRLADAIIVSSGFLVQVFARVGLEAHTVPNIVDFDQFPYRARRDFRPVFLSNRHLERDYNVACVLRAFARIQAAYPEASLIVAGEGRERRALETLVGELGLRSVRFVGRVQPDQMPAWLNATDIYLNAPDVDNQPGSILEAFACGLPVVTTDAGGIPFIVQQGETGLIVPRGDHNTMAAAAIRLLQDPASARRLASNAMRECRRRYAAESVVPQWLSVYQDARSRTSPRNISATPLPPTAN